LPSSLRCAASPRHYAAPSRMPARRAALWKAFGRHAISPLRVAVLLEVVVVHLQIVVLDEIIVEFVVVIVAEFVVVELVLVELLVVLELVVADRLDILFAEDVVLVVPVALLALHVHPSDLALSVTP